MYKRYAVKVQEMGCSSSAQSQQGNKTTGINLLLSLKIMIYLDYTHLKVALSWFQNTIFINYSDICEIREMVYSAL